MPGDGFFVAFPDADVGTGLRGRDPATARRTSTSQWVRAAGSDGCSTRPPRPTTAADYTGMGVHTAARISSLAGAGEILASTETMGEALDVRTSAARTAHLKGIAEPVDVVAIEWRD